MHCVYKNNTGIPYKKHHRRRVQRSTAICLVEHRFLNTRIVYKVEMDVIDYGCYFENKIIAQTRVLQESLVA